MSVSRRTLLLAGGTTATLLPLGGILPAAHAATPSAAEATPAVGPNVRHPTQPTTGMVTTPKRIETAIAERSETPKNM